MTEEIIINGVNVAGCEYYYEMDDCDGCHQLCNNATDIKNEYCEHYKDCYYKQLQRLKQENFALTQESQQKSQTICELKQENEELKKETEKISDGLLKIQYKLANNCDKYRSALEEIREIASFHITDADSQDVQDDMQEIIDKINEVLNENQAN